MATSFTTQREEFSTKKKAFTGENQQLEDAFNEEQKTMNAIDEQIAQLKSRLAKLQCKKSIHNRAFLLIQDRVVYVTGDIFKTKLQFSQAINEAQEDQLLTKRKALIRENKQLEDVITEKIKAMKAIDEKIAKLEATLAKLNKELSIHSFVFSLIKDRLTNVSGDISKTECQVVNEACKSRRKIMKLIKANVLKLSSCLRHI